MEDGTCETFWRQWDRRFSLRLERLRYSDSGTSRPRKQQINWWPLGTFWALKNIETLGQLCKKRDYKLSKIQQKNCKTHGFWRTIHQPLLGKQKKPTGTHLHDLETKIFRSESVDQWCLSFGFKCLFQIQYIVTINVSIFYWPVSTNITTVIFPTNDFINRVLKVCQNCSVDTFKLTFKFHFSITRSNNKSQ